MKQMKKMNKLIKPLIAVAALSAFALPASALQIDLGAKQYTKTMPDGSTVPMWGYVDVTAAGCYNMAYPARIDCVNAQPDPEVTGPKIVIPNNQDWLRIRLVNALPEPTSIYVDGWELAYSGLPTRGPTWDNGLRSAFRPDPTVGFRRVRSYGIEANPNGRRTYTWIAARNNEITRNGTFVYRSGTSPQKQVYMGLYGMVTRDAAAGEVQPGVAYDNEVDVFYSDIDVEHNHAVDDLYNGCLPGSLDSAPTTLVPEDQRPFLSPVDACVPYTTSWNRHADWFLINGAPYESGITAPIAAGETGTTTLLRFASAATEMHVALLQNHNMDILGENGHLYGWTDAAGTLTPVARKQYSVQVPPFLAKDALISATTAGDYALYDGNGYMTNPSDPTDELVGDEIGGMLRFLTFTAPVVP